MIVGTIALALASAFCGAATYINIAEHPARMMLDDANALRQWSPSYDRAFNFQGGLAVLSGMSGLVAAWLGSSWLWALGGLLMLANWPYTLGIILPLNKQLKAINPPEAGQESRAMLEKWNQLHRNRSLLSGVAVLAYCWALTGA